MENLQKRAFINGKIPLSKAESILDVIESNSDASHQIAINQYTGHVYQTISTCRESLMSILQTIEATLEFPDDVGQIKHQVILNECSTICDTLAPIIASSDYGAIIKKGLSYLIIGKPNVGKSSILNQLSGESRSIVTDTAGTTRDYIDITIEYKGILITLIDTAGIHDTDSTIEKIGIEKIKDLSKNADGYIIIEDANSATPFTPPSFISQSKPIIHIKNKIDLSPSTIETSSQSDETPIIYTSCKTKEGLPQLKEALVSTFVKPDQYDPQQMLCNLRQIAALNNAFQLIKNARSQIENNHTLDTVCIDLRDAIHELSDIMGDDFTESLLDGIFSRFCIGK